MIYIVVAIILVVIAFSKYVKNKESNTSELLYEKKNYSNKYSFQVDITNAKVTEHSWVENKTSLGYKINDNISIIHPNIIAAKGLEDLMGRDTSEKIDHINSVIEITMPQEYVNKVNEFKQNNISKEEFTELTSITHKITLPLDEKTVLIKFYLQKFAYIYADKSNPELIEIDLSFLK